MARKEIEPGTVIFIYGPPGSGKSQAGTRLAEDLRLPFTDLDRVIEARRGESIAQIFTQYGEEQFRRYEREALDQLLAHGGGVVSLGGGALLDPSSREMVEQRGSVVCLNASPGVLLERLSASDEARPLLQGDLRESLKNLLERRKDHYASFPLQIETSVLSPDEIAWQTQIELGIFHVRGMGQGYDVRIQAGGLDCLGELLSTRGMRSPAVVVSDENVAKHYAERVADGLRAAGIDLYQVVLQPGEQFKNLSSVERLWSAFTQAGVERSSSVVALGGGMIGDLAGFAAATYVRGVAWVVVPTSLLAMVDASLGGKTGFDLPNGKNLVGAFHPPRFVLADPHVLQTLPQAELRSGLAEVVKHGIIGDPLLFDACAQGWHSVTQNLAELVRRSMAVKVRVIQVDPFEQNERAKLNLGHTLGHAIEHASGYRLRHGEAVAIGTLAAARLSERLGIGEHGLADQIAAVLRGLELPTEIPPDLPRAQVLQAIGMDKKRAAGKVRLVLPVRIGEVRCGIEIENVGILLDLGQNIK